MNSHSEDHVKTYMFHKDRYVERDPLQWILKLSGKEIPMMSTIWCKNNCSHKWAWWFDVDNCYIGFENFQEYHWFKLVHF